MLHYRIEIQGNSSGELWYDVSFQSAESKSDVKKFNSADIEYIYSTVDKLAEGLKALPNPQA